LPKVLNFFSEQTDLEREMHNSEIIIIT